MTDFAAYFTRATGIQTGPHDYQCRLACGTDARTDRPDTLQQGTDCPSRLIDIPTGLGKTAAVILAWLWNCLRSQAVTSKPSRAGNSPQID